MARGVIYVMTTIVPGLIKIGKTGIDNFEQRMYNLEHNGYNNVTGLNRSFAIEVDNYDEKESLLQMIFEKSQVSNTELFSIDINIVTQLLSSFEGTIIYPRNTSNVEIFNETSDINSANYIPDGVYHFRRRKQSESNKTINATAKVQNGYWTLKENSILSMIDDGNVPQKAHDCRDNMPVDTNGKLLIDVSLGQYRTKAYENSSS